LHRRKKQDKQEIPEGTEETWYITLLQLRRYSLMMFQVGALRNTQRKAY